MKATTEQAPRHVHIIGICGVAMSAIAIAFHKKGIRVTGSDKGFFPPVSTELEKHGITFYAGWHPEKMTETGKPDLVIIGTASGTQNPETLFAQEKGIPAYSYPEALARFFVKENSIITAGTWGKTSSAALLSHILDAGGFDPSYMFGGISLSHDASAKLTDSAWSVFEGDEYKSSPTDSRPKFFHYKPTHVLLTAVSWDHADLYPTEQSYFDTFRKMIAGVPSRGLIVANIDNAGVQSIIGSAIELVITYGSGDADYMYSNATQTKSVLSFTITHKGVAHQITSPLIGLFQAENITGCFALAHELGLPAEKITAAIAIFKGMKRRLEKRLDGEVSPAGITVFDDIAHSPEKATSVLKNIRGISTGKIYTIFEPNIGGRTREAAHKYEGAFAAADTVLIPRLTKLKTKEGDTSLPMEGAELVSVISKTHPATNYIENDAQLVDYLVTHAQKGDVIAFLGSHGFRNMIEETIARITSLHQ